MAAPTKAEIEAERDRLRAENETLRYVIQCLLESGRCEADAHVHRSAAQKSLLEAVGLFTTPNIPNN